MNAPRPKGEFHKPTWESWVSMKRRCFTETYKEYRYWLDREVEDFETDVMCSKWGSYEGFLADMGERPERTRLVRLDNTKGYYPENCAWKTRDFHAGERRGTARPRRVTDAITWETVWGMMR